jgi:hypothetical protein
MYTIFSAVQRQQRKSDVFRSHRLQRRLLSGSSLQVPHCRPATVPNSIRIYIWTRLVISSFSLVRQFKNDKFLYLYYSVFRHD